MQAWLLASNHVRLYCDISPLLGLAGRPRRQYLTRGVFSGVSGAAVMPSCPSILMRCSEVLEFLPAVSQMAGGFPCVVLVWKSFPFYEVFLSAVADSCVQNFFDIV